MDEFSLIETYFKKPNVTSNNDVLVGIGDDAACLRIPSGYDLLVSTDTLVANVHFLEEWDAYEIAWKALMVNISDIAAMGGLPKWVSLALTLPTLDTPWLTRFSQGLNQALSDYNLTLIGGDTTHGPLTITITIHGLIPYGKQITRHGAKPGDIIWVTGELGAGALAVNYLTEAPCTNNELAILMKKLKAPEPRVDMRDVLQEFASAAIDISDGLSADLNHICMASQVGASLFLEKIPLHPIVITYEKDQALDFALSGGDDYELCFTVPKEKDLAFKSALAEHNLTCFPIGIIEEKKGMRSYQPDNTIITLIPKGYNHF